MIKPPIYFFLILITSAFSTISSANEISNIGGLEDTTRFCKNDGYPLKRLYHEDCFQVGSFTNMEKLFPFDPISKPAKASRLLDESISDNALIQSIEDVKRTSPITALLISRDGKLIHEYYGYDRKPSQKFASFSMHKSFNAILVGIALERGLIGSIDDPVSNYLPELATTNWAKISIFQLLTMTSGMRQDQVGMIGAHLFKNNSVFDVLKTQDHLDFRPGETFNYSDANTYVIGLILEAVFKKSWAEIFQTEIWWKIGAESNASVLTNERGETAFSAYFNATPRDYMRLSLLLLNKGRNHSGDQVIPENWIAFLGGKDERLRSCPTAPSKNCKNLGRFGYSAQTWITPSGNSYFFQGKYGQLIFLNEATNTSVVMLSVGLGGNKAQLFTPQFRKMLANLQRTARKAKTNTVSPTAISPVDKKSQNTQSKTLELLNDFAQLNLSCGRTYNDQLGPFSEKITGLISPNGFSLVTHWSGNMRNDETDIYYHALEGRIYPSERTAKIKGLNHWAKRKEILEWEFEKSDVANFHEALSGDGMTGRYGKGEWQRECRIKIAERKDFQDLTSSNTAQKNVLEKKIAQLEERLKKARARISDLESQLETTSLKNSSETQTRNKPMGELIELSAPNAVCNDQTQAKVSVFRTNTNKWAVFFPGGGSAGSADEYLKRAKKKHFVSAPRSPSNAGAIGEHLIQLGYNLIVLPYCSSDLYQGDHLQIIGGKEVPFRGRAIVESMVDQFKAAFHSATDLVLVGSSAGSVGIGFNIDQFAKFESTRLILDSFWFDKATLSWYTKDYPRVRSARVKFQFKNLPTHCNGIFSNCWISRSLLSKHGIGSAFIIWNDGDAFQGGVKDKAKLRSAILSDLRHFKAGFSVKADKANFADNGKGHGMVNKATAYTQKFEGYSVRSLVDNWLTGNGETIFVDH